MSDRPTRGGRGGRGGFRGGRGGSGERGGRGGFRGGRGGSAERGGREMSRERRGEGFSPRGGRFDGGSRGGGDFRAERPERPREQARKSGAEAFVKSGRAARDAERLEQHREAREVSKSKARASRIDPRVESITVGSKQSWKESQEEANWCKLSTKFFTNEKIQKIKVTIDCRFKIKTIKYRTDIHFDDITHIQISEDLKTMTIETRIPTLFEVGTPVTDSDGAQSIDWQEGRGLDWQQPAKNPHPNRYTFVFKDEAFKQDALALFMNSDSRIKTLIQKENTALSDFQRGSKRSRDEVASKPTKSSAPNGEEKTEKASEPKSASPAETDASKSKPAPKKQKLSEKESVPVKPDAPTSDKPQETKKSKKDTPTTSSKDNKMQVDDKATSSAKETKKETPTKPAAKADAKKTKSSMEVAEAPSKSPKPAKPTKETKSVPKASPQSGSGPKESKKPISKSK